ncbi:ABC transporter substrate-binding protein [bacterium]|nr:ABC transporter substrate-binding protein [bacterium]
MSTDEITIYHSPDADDAFMFYGFTTGEITHPRFTFTHDLGDIQSLNERAIAGDIDVTAISVHAFAYLKNQYAILTCGASMGSKDYGPRLVTKKDKCPSLQAAKTIATPGAHTSATLALQMALDHYSLSPELKHYDFKAVFGAIERGEVDAGVIIHEGQLTYDQEGFDLLLDFGEWWYEETQLPLPLGVNVARRSLGKEALSASADILHRSIAHSLKNREQALDYAMTYARGLSREHADTFVAMYVNELTLDMGDEGRKSIELFLSRAAEKGLIPELPELMFVTPQ